MVKAKKVRRSEEKNSYEDEDSGVEDVEVMDMPKMSMKTSKKRVRIEDPKDDEAEELEREMAALRAIREEKESAQNHSAEDSAKNAIYNKEGLVKALEDWETKDLPFVETMQIGDYQLQVENELDDLEREVNNLSLLLVSLADLWGVSPL